MARLRALAANLALSVASIVVFLAVCELVVFRLIWPGSDVPANDFVDGVVRYAPHQSGIWRVRDEIAAPYRINGQGWNSGIGDYAIPRRPGVRPRSARRPACGSTASSSTAAIRGLRAGSAPPAAAT